MWEIGCLGQRGNNARIMRRILQTEERQNLGEEKEKMVA